ncbi:unnamed protein product [Didymodactylos carnosus]|uniref:NAD(P)(+)--arginine ADP-ribosyltransferase n=1 Tax=Didymodactylos carnosus TaxID=1234261 RepID=A0A815SQZ5_9BILA|nr:unnamed protein product [Didymodactylos carnosus]CAF1496148.1 unnamed protein product [Didymodactylos carnosus]CAF4164344.1 unnamed protein product [Didymodactylos carnosus]CAF4358544.1 unnamed protein product [Didymodactylos carnosus]
MASKNRRPQSTDNNTRLLQNNILCQYGTECHAFNRLMQNGYRTDDIEHCSIYFHQGRRCGITVNENFGSRRFISAYLHWDESYSANRRITFWNGKVSEGDLVRELEINGFGHVMELSTGVFKSLDEVVREQLRDPRHQQIGSPLSYDQMLSIILYTSTDVYADLRRDEIYYFVQNFEKINSVGKRDYKSQKWPVFGKVLNTAICCLNDSDNSYRPKTVYHGLQNIEIDPATFNNHGPVPELAKHHHFRYGTFISTSWDKQVALSFRGDKGSLLEIDTTDTLVNHTWKLIGADVSWISKFPIECEFLMTRGAVFQIENINFDNEQNCQVVKVSAGYGSHRGESFSCTNHCGYWCNCATTPSDHL